MKYYKFKKIVKGDNPIIRVTYKNWLGILIEKDICKCKSTEGFWVFMDTGHLTFDFDPINTFYNNDLDVYFVDGK